MKKILVIHTGGTISMTADSSGQVRPEAVNPMLAVSPSLEGVELINREPFHLPSPHITCDHMLQLYGLIREMAEQIDGVVITHGTDTLEETAYFLDTMAIPQIPIVLTGAMRSSNELGSDGVYNFLSALRVASHDKSADKGVLVVMNDEIHAAKYVTKTHTTNVSTFQTPTHGPLGVIMKHDILFFKAAEQRVRFDLKQVKGLVPIIKAYAGMTGELFSLLDPDQVSGVVIEAMGAGNLPPEASRQLDKLLQRQIPIVLVSRCFNGIAEPVYGYEGGGVELAGKGVLFVKELNAQKARLKLLIAINAGLSGQALRDYIEG
ncbi:asparaginase [Streptococcus entericus]|uniref:asparaginase n=1 Tax=Streptococcus entericus TaxID=155680 RepID=UPI000365CF36|nr:asparaginase [Streptococcus entericus]